MSGMHVRRLGYALGAEITGLDLRGDIDDETVARIHRVWLDHIAICIRGQDLTPPQLLAFAERFGSLHQHVNPSERHPDHDKVTLIVNQAVVVQGKDFAGGIGDEWHSDQAYIAQPPTVAFLNAQVLPDVGGETLFASMYAAYESLSPGLQRLIEPLEGVFDVTAAEYYNRVPADRLAEIVKRNPAVVHPIVRVHPESGRKGLYLSSQLRCFVGMTDEESRPLRDYLYNHATRYEFSYRHRWLLHDLIVWDNRCSMHRAVADYDLRQLRRMIRCELSGTHRGRLYEREAVPA